MTTHTPVPAQQAVQALRDLRRGVEMDRHNLDDGDAKLQALDAAIEALSGLRAPVVESTHRAMLRSVLQDLDISYSQCPQCGHAESCKDMDVACMIRDHLKGDASAPVAGEATVYLDAGHLREVRAGNDMPMPASAEPGPGMVPLYAAPQASEAVRILFPTHLRKMWSGGEVQAWLDEHQGITAPKPLAKGSLERYRKWRADQAGEAQCSCPSGDGCLRWPCAKHRTHSENDS